MQLGLLGLLGRRGRAAPRAAAARRGAGGRADAAAAAGPAAGARSTPAAAAAGSKLSAAVGRGLLLPSVPGRRGKGTRRHGAMAAAAVAAAVGAVGAASHGLPMGGTRSEKRSVELVNESGVDRSISSSRAFIELHCRAGGRRYTIGAGGVPNPSCCLRASDLPNTQLPRSNSGAGAVARDLLFLPSSFPAPWPPMRPCVVSIDWSLLVASSQN